MASLTAASWTVTVTEVGILTGHPAKRIAKGTMLIAPTDTYPTGGIPLPTIDKLGMQRQIDKLTFVGNPGGQTTEYVAKYDRTNHKMQLYSEEVVAAGGPLLEALASEAPGTRTWDFEAVGW